MHFLGWRLYISYICPYAQRVWIARNYKVTGKHLMAWVFSLCIVQSQCIWVLFLLVKWYLLFLGETGIAGQDQVGSYWPAKQTSLVQGESLPTKQGDNICFLSYSDMISSWYDHTYLYIMPKSIMHVEKNDEIELFHWFDLIFLYHMSKNF